MSPHDNIPPGPTNLPNGCTDTDPAPQPCKLYEITCTVTLPIVMCRLAATEDQAVKYMEEVWSIYLWQQLQTVLAEWGIAAIDIPDLSDLRVEVVE